MSFIITPLERHHNRSAFHCGSEPLDHYLQRLARQHQERNISRTFVMTTQAEPSTPLGYYSLSSGQIHYQQLPTTHKHPRYPVSIIRLARLAVDVRHQGHGLGAQLLHHALRQSLTISAMIGVYAVVVDAKNREASAFYQHYGFSPLQDHELTLYLPIHTIAQAHET